MGFPWHRAGSIPKRPAAISAPRSRSESSTRRAYPLDSVTLGASLPNQHRRCSSMAEHQLRDRIRVAIERPEVPWVAPDVTFTPYPSALRFGFAHRFISDDEAFTYTVHLISRREPSAAEAAAVILASFSEKSDANWVQTLAIQLSYDGNPAVRAEVVRALSRTADRGLANAAVARRRLTELLRDDGVIVPLKTLGGVASMQNVPPGMRAVISELQGSHPSKRVRDRAAELASP
jgi:hypothetical protein